MKTVDEVIEFLNTIQKLKEVEKELDAVTMLHKVDEDGYNEALEYCKSIRYYQGLLLGYKAFKDFNDVVEEEQ